ncbi:MAG: hypothetical protein R3C40_09120 [Parvularculaceae bacterium]
MSPVLLRALASGFLLGNGVLHLAVAFFLAPAQLKAPLAVFGVVYFLLGVWTRLGGRTAMLCAVLVTALGLGLGGANYIQSGGGSWTMPVMFVIDVAVLFTAGGWLLKNRQAG